MLNKEKGRYNSNIAQQEKMCKLMGDRRTQKGGGYGLVLGVPGERKGWGPL